MGEATKRKQAGQYPDTTIPRWDSAKAFSAMARASMGRRVTTPAIPYTPLVSRFMAALVPSARPIRLPFTNFGAPYQAGFCQVNVTHRVLNHGGKRIDGWMIWTNGVFVDAEAHSVWEAPNGVIQDITGRPDNEAEIVFLPDPSARIIRITHDGRDCDALLCNRTSIPECPFTAQGVPKPGPFNYFAYPPGGRQHVKSIWGTDSAESF